MSDPMMNELRKAKAKLREARESIDQHPRRQTPAERAKVRKLEQTCARLEFELYGIEPPQSNHSRRSTTDEQQKGNDRRRNRR